MSKAQTNDLLAELDAEFGKKPKQKKVDVKGQTVTARNSTNGFSDFVAENNEIAKSIREQPGWMPVDRVTFIIHQHCRCCEETISYVGNEFVRYYNKRLRAKVSLPELRTHDEFGIELERVIDEFDQTIEQCVKCLIIEQTAGLLVQAVNLSLTGPRQGELH